MTDAELVEAFELGTLPPDAFTHTAHVRVARWYVLHEPMLVAIARFRAALMRFAARIGKPEKYHETITVGYMLVIADRLRGAGEQSWEAFAAANADLLQTKPSVLVSFYSDAVLDSAAARAGFVAPDLALSERAESSRRTAPGAPATAAGRSA
jgi:hypothetical protein